MEKIYSTTMTNEGGRMGTAYSPDKSFTLSIVQPGSGNEGTNPEQLFAAGFASCFNGALGLVMLRQRLKAASTVSATVTLYDQGKQDYLLEVNIEGHIEGIDAEKTLALLEEADTVCPYSKATKGNIKVTVKAV